MSDSPLLSERRARLSPEQQALLRQRLGGRPSAAGGAEPAPAPALDALPRSGLPEGAEAPLSWAQQGQWFLWRMDPGNTAYHVGGGLDFEGTLDAAALHAALQALVRRHAGLRTVFGEGDDGMPWQRVEPAREVPLPCTDLSGLAPAGRDARLEALAREVCAEPFDLRRGPLLRCALARLGPREHRLLFMMHHIASDAWTVERILDEWARGYADALEGRAPSDAPPALRYVDFAVWQRQWLRGPEAARHRDYWTRQLAEEAPVLQIGRGTAAPALQSPSAPETVAAQHLLAVPAPLAQALRQRARAHGTTLFCVLLAAFHAVLFRHAGHAVQRVGVPVAGRNRPETADMAGVFINTVVMQARPAPQMPLSALLAQVHATALEAREHEDLPFEHVAQVLRPERGHEGGGLFQCMFNHLGEGGRPLAGWPGLAVRRVDPGLRAAPFGLTLETMENPGGGLLAAFRYDAAKFTPQEMAEIAGHYERMLDALAHDPERPVGEVAMLGDAERARLRAWSAGGGAVAMDLPVHRMFERQAALTPDAPALMSGDREWTYAQLDARTSRLAQRLRAGGVGPETLVGVALARGTDMVEALLAVLKAGGAYVPLDPELPADRIAYMLGDCAPALVLTDAGHRACLPSEMAQPVVLLPLEDALPGDAEEAACPPVALHPEHLAYVIYTSGSTGRPKGAANRHGALSNRIAWMQQAYGLGPGDTVLQKTPFGFDVSVWEFFWPLAVGARLAVAPPGAHREPAELQALIQRHAVTTLHFVPSMLQALLAQLDAGACASVRRIVCSGEALPAEARRQVLERLPGAALYNLYGPTEAAIDVTHWTCHAQERGPVPIGRPIAGLRTHVLDAAMQPVPAGAAGELFLGGAGLARGYAARPGLTAERFVADPFEAGARLYRTGDLVRWHGDGALEYLGRLDHQVKIRGQRIELGEIEARLLASPGVREAVAVAASTPAGTALVAYCSPQADAVLDGEALRALLAAELPEAMVPSQIAVLPALPLNANGKVDRKALPSLQPASTAAYTAPQGEVEEALARMWCELLALPRAGRADHFFAQGGHSLMAMQLVARVRSGLQAEISVRDVFLHPVLADLAQCVEAARPQRPVADALSRLDAFLDDMEMAG
ncbi:non-ribosomal peptide synthetase [Paracidovorax avenae]|uniref:non-ribosomal peptide synthetase n=1 Tax=Paracidovorax avenae TaxID=80867 RepID=UPI000D161355|nr:non-ribosomal peptide synthetase [Paracidovorax avenae]AVS89489.1 non-ribosomal peptide synthetase [Paracidovorax avenae]